MGKVRAVALSVSIGVLSLFFQLLDMGSNPLKGALYIIVALLVLGTEYWFLKTLGSKPGVVDRPQESSVQPKCSCAVCQHCMWFFLEHRGCIDCLGQGPERGKLWNPGCPRHKNWATDQRINRKDGS